MTMGIDVEFGTNQIVEFYTFTYAILIALLRFLEPRISCPEWTVQGRKVT
jgi:hypothetical protein